MAVEVSDALTLATVRDVGGTLVWSAGLAPRRAVVGLT